MKYLLQAVFLTVCVCVCAASVVSTGNITGTSENVTIKYSVTDAMNKEVLEAAPSKVQLGSREAKFEEIFDPEDDDESGGYSHYVGNYGGSGVSVFAGSMGAFLAVGTFLAVETVLNVSSRI